MKVLFVHHICELHGSSISLLNMVSGLKKRGVEVFIALPKNVYRDKEFIRLINNLDIPTYYANMVLFIDREGWSRKWWNVRAFYSNWMLIIKRRLHSYRELCKIVDEIKPDIIHTNVGIIHDAYWVARKYRIPHIFHIREYQDCDFCWKILPSKALFVYLLKSSAAVIFITHDLQRHFNLQTNTNAYTVYNGIYSERDVCYIREKDWFFLCASRISKEKGYEEVIKAFAEFHKINPMFSLKIAGDGDTEYIKNLQSLVDKYGCLNQIEFLGHLSPDEIKSLLQKARALIVGSYNEAFGRMTAEAAMQGCLIIGRKTAGTEEIINTVGGYSFKTIDQMEEKMQEICRLDMESYRIKAINSQKIAIKSYSIEQNVENIYNIYKKILTI